MVNFLLNTHNRHPIACPWGQAMGCLLWVLSRKLIMFLRSVFSDRLIMLLWGVGSNKLTKILWGVISYKLIIILWGVFSNKLIMLLWAVSCEVERLSIFYLCHCVLYTISCYTVILYNDIQLYQSFINNEFWIQSTTPSQCNLPESSQTLLSSHHTNLIILPRIPPHDHVTSKCYKKLMI